MHRLYSPTPITLVHAASPNKAPQWGIMLNDGKTPKPAYSAFKSFVAANPLQ